MVGFFTELSGPLEVGHLEGGLSLEATALTTGEGLVGPLEAKRRGRSFMLTVIYDRVYSFVLFLRNNLNLNNLSRAIASSHWYSGSTPRR